MPLVLQATGWKGNPEAAMSNKPTHGQPRQLRRKYRRIDYYPSPAATAAINAKWDRCYPLNTRSGVINAILAEWVDLTGIEMLPEFRSKTPTPNAGIVAQYARANDSDADGYHVLAGMLAKSKVKQVICGARTQSARACRCKSLPGKRRCKWHGGCSTGPKTAEGRAKALRNLVQYHGRPPSNAAEVARARARGGKPLQVPTEWPAKR